MPNPANVAAPVTLVGSGRSGTTLVTRIFRRHPDFQALGESAGLCWSAYHWQHKWLRNTGRFSGGRDLDEVARDGVHGLLCATYPSPAARWFQKPIFLPDVYWTFEDKSAFPPWYWQASRVLFPQGRFFTVLRDPADTAASIMQRWDESEQGAFGRLERVFTLMLHAESRVELVLPFDRLQEEPEAAVRRLMEFAGAPFHDSLLETFAQSHAANPAGERASGLRTPPRVQALYEELLARA